MRIRRPGILSLLLPIVFLGARDSAAVGLTFEDRVVAQEAIERVYYSHQIGATKPFEEAVARAVLERKVRTYLEQSAALEALWKTSVSDEMLGRELERMAGGTRLPERLLELYRALGNNPFLIKECLARPILVNRLARNFFSFDTRIHREARHEAEEIHQQLAEGTLDPSSEYHDRSVARLFLRKQGTEPAEKSGSHLQETGDNNVSQDLSPEEFRKQRARWPGAVGEISAVQEERDTFVIRVVLSEEREEMRGAIYQVQKTTWEEWWRTVENRIKDAPVRPAGRLRGRVPLPAIHSGPAPEGGNEASEDAPNGWASAETTCGPPDNTWDNVSLDDLPDPRVQHAAVWTGSLMLIWGGGDNTGGTPLNSGGRYDPATDTWSPMSTTNAPSGRASHTAVWTGSLMLVWGGFDGSYLNTGGRYDPVTDTWSPISIANAPSPRYLHTVVWTGSVMAIWGGRTGNTHLNTGGRYDPAADTWASISTLNAPSGRSLHTALWTGSLMLVWGGWDPSYLNTGGRYDPVADTWSAVSIANAPSPRYYHTAVWSGGLMVIWGGYGGSTTVNTGGRYDPATDSWTSTSITNAPSGRYAQTAVWTGGLMLVWGGGDAAGIPFNTGGRYDPAADLWSPISPTNAPSTRSYYTAVWTGSLMVVWGGTEGGSNSVNTGGRYEPTTDSWTPTSTTTAPTARSNHTALWTGSLMVVWGGSGSVNGPKLNTGGRYDPATDVWTPTSTTIAPTARYSHTAVWTGSLMVIWGGVEGVSNYVNTGGRYDPISNTWAPTSTTGAPTVRSDHTAVWTGSRMVVWGGFNGLAYLNTGGRYDPATDSWTPMSITNTPTGRWRHTALWTGSRMLVWGGSASPTGGGPPFNTGGRYDPAANSWTPITTTNAPIARYGHSAVWTGSRMVVWGGTETNIYYSTGGRYDPAADAWTPTSTINPPSARAGHTAIWTGSLMLVWGGYAMNGQIHFNTGGRYDPALDNWTPTSTANAPSARYGHSAVWSGSLMLVWGGGFSSGGRLIVSQFPDLDRDGYPGCADCNDSDALAWHSPLMVTNLALSGAGPTSVSWDNQGSAVGPGTVYDLVSGALASGVVSFSGVCLQPGGSSQYSDTRASPALGFGYWYLARGRNSCGTGTYGTAQRDAAVTACP